jgi:hypothetical protein
VTAEEAHVDFAVPILEEKPQREGSTALEQLAAELADSYSAVRVWQTKALGHLAERKKAPAAFVSRQFSETPENVGVDGEELSQALFSTPRR